MTFWQQLCDSMALPTATKLHSASEMVSHLSRNNNWTNSTHDCPLLHIISTQWLLTSMGQANRKHGALVIWRSITVWAPWISEVKVEADDRSRALLCVIRMTRRVVTNPSHGSHLFKRIRKIHFCIFIKCMQQYKIYGLTGQSLLKIQFEIPCLNNCTFQCAIFNFSGSFKLELALKSSVY